MNLEHLDRRIIYLFVILAISVPILTRYSVKPAKMAAAERFYSMVEKVKPEPGKVAVLAMDFGPNTKAENEAQAEVVLEHLFRKRIPVVVFTLYAQAEVFVSTIPEKVADRLARENPGEVWEYGEDWVNLGYKPGWVQFVQAMAKAKSLSEYLKKDAYGTDLQNVSLFKGVGGIEDVVLLTEFTGLVGAFDTYVQFFQKEGYTPIFGHGCTSITIPEAYIYLDSGQLTGLLEGIAGAAWYSELLRKNNPKREPDAAAIQNTALGVAHLVIIFFVIMGNLVGLRNLVRAS